MLRPLPFYDIQGYSSIGRAAVSKTVGSGFKSLCPCQNWEFTRNLVNSQFFVVEKFKSRISRNSKNASEPTVLTNCEVQSMRMKMVCDDRTLAEVANEFLALKKAQKVRERTLNDYKKYIDKFLEQSQNSLDVDVLKIEILEYFADIPKTSPARFNHPYQYLHALFAWAAKQDYIPYNPFEKLELKKVRDEGKCSACGNQGHPDASKGSG